MIYSDDNDIILNNVNNIMPMHSLFFKNINRLYLLALLTTKKIKKYAYNKRLKKLLERRFELRLEDCVSVSFKVLGDG